MVVVVVVVGISAMLHDHGTLIDAPSKAMDLLLSDSR